MAPLSDASPINALRAAHWHGDRSHTASANAGRWCSPQALVHVPPRRGCGVLAPRPQPLACDHGGSGRRGRRAQRPKSQAPERRAPTGLLSASWQRSSTERAGAAEAAEAAEAGGVTSRALRSRREDPRTIVAVFREG